MRPLLLMMLPLLMLLLDPAAAFAVTTFDDGGVHLIDGASDAVEVLNSTTVLTVSGAQVLATSFDIAGITASGDSTLGIFGGSVLGSFGVVGGCIEKEFCVNTNPRDGIIATGGVVTIDAGLVMGGQTSSSFFTEPTGVGLRAIDVTNLVVSGGVVEGGFGGGVGMVLDGVTDALVSGGSLKGGAVDNVLDGLAPAAHLTGNSHTEITGGAFVGGSANDDPAARGPSLFVEESASIESRGGTFEGPWTIRGPDAVVEVYGSDFSLFSLPRGSVSLSGELEDGSSLGVLVLLENGAAFPVLHEVPETSGAWLTFAALGAVALLKRS